MGGHLCCDICVEAVSQDCTGSKETSAAHTGSLGKARQGLRWVQNWDDRHVTLGPRATLHARPKNLSSENKQVRE